MVASQNDVEEHQVPEQVAAVKVGKPGEKPGAGHGNGRINHASLPTPSTPFVLLWSPWVERLDDILKLRQAARRAPRVLSAPQEVRVALQPPRPKFVWSVAEAYTYKTIFSYIRSKEIISDFMHQFSFPKKDLARPILTVFMCYTSQDRPSIKLLIDTLESANVEVYEFLRDEPLGVNPNEWIIEAIASSDCIFVVASDNSLAHPRWVEREIGLGFRLLQESGVAKPTILPIRIGSINRDKASQRFQARDFESEVPMGPVIDCAANCMRLDRDGVSSTVQNFLNRFTPKTEFITSLDNDHNKRLFESAVRLYKILLPDEHVRDHHDDVESWICESWDKDNIPKKSCDWSHVLAVHHVCEKVVGIFWCSVNRSTGIGFVSFWGVRAAHRYHGRSNGFAGEVIAFLRRVHTNMRALLFAAERIKWSVLDKVLQDAVRLHNRQSIQSIQRGRGRYRGGEWHDELVEPIAGQPSAVMQVLRSLSSAKQDVVIEELRRLRRFILFTKSSSHVFLKGESVTIQAYANKEGVKKDLMAEFVQPPIRVPVNESSNGFLWLFGLFFDGHTLAPSEAVDWIYDVFLKETLGAGQTKVEGWNEYMVGFKRRWRDPFVNQAEAKSLRRLSENLAPYISLLGETRKFCIHEQAAGRATGRPDTQL